VPIPEWTNSVILGVTMLIVIILALSVGQGIKERCQRKNQTRVRLL
jgi:hypothetical protein